jgi:hypothetical protein
LQRGEKFPFKMRCEMKSLLSDSFDAFVFIGKNFLSASITISSCKRVVAIDADIGFHPIFCLAPQ